MADIEPKGPVSVRDAVIYVPGLFADGDQVTDRIALRIASALNLTSPPEVSFSVSPGTDESVGQAGQWKVRGVTIMKRPDAETPDTPLIDVYELDYAADFRRVAEKRPPIVQAIHVAALVVLNAWPVLRSLFAKSKSLGHRIQAFYGVVILAVMVLYAGTMIYASYAAVQDARSVHAETSPKTPTSAPKPTEKRSYIEAAILVMTALGLFSKKSLKEGLTKVGVEACGALGYIAYGMRASVLTGAVSNLVDHILQEAPKRRVKYRRLHLVAYSFGSVVALDALFPRGGGDPPDRARDIDSLITIGCPFDFIRGYWPSYFKGRGGFAGAPKHWLNVYRNDDVLASNFVDVGDERMAREGASTRGIVGDADGTVICKPQNQQYGSGEPIGINGVLLAGFRAHGDYWQHGETDDANVFVPIVRFLSEERCNPQEQSVVA
jgi:hypothetical protein